MPTQGMAIPVFNSTGPSSRASKGYSARLRAGSPIPASGGRLILHIFGSETSQIDTFAATNKLPSSNDFRGQGGNYFSANFTRLNAVGGDTFSGKIVHAPVLSPVCSINHRSSKLSGFIECTSLSLSYNVFGLVTVSFVVVHEEPVLHSQTSITVANQTFSGTMINAFLQPLPNTSWFESHITLLALTSDSIQGALIGIGGAVGVRST